jgi:predicted nucleic acid-binding protein
MTTHFVLDASLTLSWCFRDEANPQSLALLDRLAAEAALVPALWQLEVANALAMAERRGRITPERVDDFLRELGVLEIEIDHETAGRSFSHLLPLCRDHALTSYDAAYLDLARRRRLPLATLDADLIRVAERLGVPLAAAN